MSTVALFFLAHFALIVIGWPAAVLPGIRHLALPARIAAAFGAGAVAVTLLMLFLSFLRVPWTVLTVGLPLGIFAILCGFVFARMRDQEWSAQPRSADRTPGVAVVAFMLVASVSVAYVLLMFWTTRATSMDFLFFWGVKAVRFVEAQGIDAALLRWRFFTHAVPEYPPLVPLVTAWATLFSKQLPWVQAPTVSAFWFVATIPLLYELLRQVTGNGAGAAATAAFWSAALGPSLVYSYSAGNAEAPLLFFETVAALCLLVDPDRRRRSVGLAAIAVAGAVLTKAEGSVAVFFLLAGAALSDLLRSRRMSRETVFLVLVLILSLTAWFGFQFKENLPVGYRPHGQLWTLSNDYWREIVVGVLRNSSGGTGWFAWIFTVLLLILQFRRYVSLALPTLVASVGLMGFFVFDYLHDLSDPTLRISWTFSRTSQPILSFAIITAAISCFRESRGANGAATADY